MLAPLAAVLLFLAAIISAFGYLRAGGDGSRAGSRQARRRIRAAAGAPAPAGAPGAADAHRARHLQQGGGRRRIRGPRGIAWSASIPELQAVTWIDERRRIKASYAAPSVPPSSCGARRRSAAAGRNREQLQPGARPAAAGVFAARWPAATAPACCSCTFRCSTRAALPACILGEYLHRRPAALRRAGRSLGQVRGGAARRQGPAARRQLGRQPRNPATQLLPWAAQTNEYEVPVSPVGNGLMHPRAGLPHFAGRDRQRPVLAGRRAAAC